MKRLFVSLLLLASERLDRDRAAVLAPVLAGKA